MAPGRFITFEGGEGAGKSTQARRLAEWLRKRGIDVIETREPGGSPAAERVREALLNLPPETGTWHADAECLLHFAARRQHIADVIQPALQKGEWVISDRFADSTMAYQGYAGGVGPARVATLEAWALGGPLGGFSPDLTLILDLSVESGLERVRARGAASDIYERRPQAFHKAVRDGFLAIAASAPARCSVIDAARELDAVSADIMAAVRARLGMA